MTVDQRLAFMREQNKTLIVFADLAKPRGVNRDEQDKRDGTGTGSFWVHYKVPRCQQRPVRGRNEGRSLFFHGPITTPPNTGQRIGPSLTNAMPKGNKAHVLIQDVINNAITDWSGLEIEFL